MDCSPPGFSVHGIILARITGAGCHFLLQGIFTAQDWTHIFYISVYWQADFFFLFNHWATWEASKSDLSLSTYLPPYCYSPSSSSCHLWTGHLQQLQKCSLHIHTCSPYELLEMEIFLAHCCWKIWVVSIVLRMKEQDPQHGLEGILAPFPTS